MQFIFAVHGGKWKIDCVSDRFRLLWKPILIYIYRAACSFFHLLPVAGSLTYTFLRALYFYLISFLSPNLVVTVPCWYWPTVRDGCASRKLKHKFCSLTSLSSACVVGCCSRFGFSVCWDVCFCCRCATRARSRIHIIFDCFDLIQYTINKYNYCCFFFCLCFRVSLRTMFLYVSFFDFIRM